MPHSQSYSSVLPIIVQENKVLLHLRQNTAYMDGFWDLAGSGHIDALETAKEALVRECQEELGILVEEENLEFAYLFHNVGLDENPTYFHLYFRVKAYKGDPRIMEPEKNAGLAWYDIDRLPENIIPMRKQVLEEVFSNKLYGEQKQ